jgi:hypothetical protein
VISFLATKDLSYELKLKGKNSKMKIEKTKIGEEEEEDK